MLSRSFPIILVRHVTISYCCFSFAMSSQTQSFLVETFSSAWMTGNRFGRRIEGYLTIWYENRLHRWSQWVWMFNFSSLHRLVVKKIATKSCQNFVISREKKLTIPTVDPIIRILNHWSRSWLLGSSREDLMIFWNTDLWSSNYKTKSLFWWFFPSETYLANIWCQHNGKFSVST